MRIVQVVDSLDAGGFERVAVDLSNELALRGVTSYICATRRGGPLEKDLHEKVNYLSLNRKSTWDWKAIKSFRKWVTSEEIKVVHAHGNSSAMFCTFALTGLNVFIIHHDHNPIMEMRNKWREWLLLKKVDEWICVSEPIWDWAKNTIGYKTPLLINNPIDISRFDNQVKKKSNRIRFIHLANYKPHKDHANLIESVGLVVEKNKNFKIDCYGTNFESPYFRQMQKLIESKGLQPFIELHPSHNNIPQLLIEFHAGLLSSDAEGLPISLLEYMACGLPVIVTDVGNCKKVVTAANSGLVTPSRSPLAFSEALLQFINNYKHWAQIGRSGITYVNNNHSLQHFGDQLMPIYNKALINN